MVEQALALGLKLFYAFSDCLAFVCRNVSKLYAAAHFCLNAGFQGGRPLWSDWARSIYHSDTDPGLGLEGLCVHLYIYLICGVNVVVENIGPIEAATDEAPVLL